MSTYLAASFGSYDHPFFGSRATPIRMYPSASQSGQRSASRIRPFTGKAASNSRPDLIGRGTAMRTVATTINPTTRELQVVAGLTQANAGECHPGGTPDPQLSRRGGPGGADPEGNPDLGGDLAGRRTDARRSVHAGGEGADRTSPGRGPRPDDGRRHPGRLERGGARRPHDRECRARRNDNGRGADGPERRRG